jgi:hypothetical protein
MAPRTGFEPATLRLIDAVKIPSALSGVAYRKLGAILASLVVPNPAPKFRHSELQFKPKLDRSRTADLIERVKARVVTPGEAISKCLRRLAK